MGAKCRYLCNISSVILVVGFVLSLIFTTTLMGCAGGGVKISDKEPSGVFVSGGMIHSKGYGVSRKGDPPATRILTAREAAYTIALGNMLEFVEGAQIDSETNVKDGALDTQEIQKAVEGTVKNVVVFREGIVQKTRKRVIYFIELGMKK